MLSTELANFPYRRRRLEIIPLKQDGLRLQLLPVRVFSYFDFGCKILNLYASSPNTLIHIIVVRENQIVQTDKLRTL